MAAPTFVKSYSITDARIAPLTGETPGTLIDLPGIRSIEVTLATDSTELRGDNTVIAVANLGQTLEFQAEAGGISFDAYKTMTGKNYTDTGTTPAITRTMHFGGSDDRPYFYLVGVAPADDGVGSLELHVYKAKLTGNVQFGFKDGEFMTPGFTGKGVPRTADGRLFTLAAKETASTPTVIA